MQNDNLEAIIQSLFDKLFIDAGFSLNEAIIKHLSVPSGWTSTVIGEKCSVQTGPFGSQLHNEDYVEIGTPIITVEHLAGKYIAHNNLPLVCDEDRDRLKKYDLHTGDVVFSRVGSVDRAAMVSPYEDGWLFSGRCLRVRPNEPQSSAYYLWWFSQPIIKQLVSSAAVGATMPSINTTILSGISLILPPEDLIAESCSIATSILDRVWANNAEIRLLQCLQNSIQGMLSR